MYNLNNIRLKNLNMPTDKSLYVPHVYIESMALYMLDKCCSFELYPKVCWLADIENDEMKLPRKG